MGKSEIDQWAQERVKLPDGKWASDTMFCILYLMENRAPYLWDREGNKEEYMQLIDLACEYLNQSHSPFDAFSLGMRLVEDSRNLSPERRSELLESAKQQLCPRTWPATYNPV